MIHPPLFLRPESGLWKAAAVQINIESYVCVAPQWHIPALVTNHLFLLQCKTLNTEN